MTISRDRETVYEDGTSTGEMVRSCEELVSYFTRHNAVPELAVVLTGTSLVPETPFDLQAADRVEIEIEGIGTLANPVTEV
jgi:2-dehydro-3-deoxy-D-arabinonate dehydratase